MGIYGKTAVAVVSAYDSSNKPDPRECWEYSITLFTNSRDSQRKGCPKSAFLGLCQDGYVKGIPKGDYLPPDSPNKRYAVVAAECVLKEPSRKYSRAELWRIATKDCPDAAENENGQIDVVLTLKDAGLLQHPD
ncbi:DUF6979 family protein [Dickeya lacustris]|uniref:Uncharacterized protein n=1 Tax=Dickeya lacustris TaxID=2259638 RepID=A0ABY8G7W1_9GAMM|nr:hypothetical protein [Dickeya lacustris]WFN55995.1 hypothetical protein O1Q98_01295 [Dickeya lacustris]